MQQIVLQEPGQFQSTEASPISTLPEGYARVRVHRVGICGTDLHAFQGKQTFFSYPRVLGHELGVEVIEIAKGDKHARPGDRCAIEPYMNCGSCIACRRGKPNCCTSMQVLGVHMDGGMQDELIVPGHKLHCSETLGFESLALVETLCIGAHAVQRPHLEEGETVLVIGAGPIGLTVLTFAAIANVKLLVLDMNEQRLSFCQQQFPSCITIKAGDDTPGAIMNAAGGELPTAVFDCTGNPSSMVSSIDYCAHGARLVWVGHFPGDITFNDPNFHKRELTLMGSRNATPDDFKHTIALLESGRIDVSPWITHRASPEAMIKEFPSWLQPETGVIKAVVEWAE